MVGVAIGLVLHSAFIIQHSAFPSPFLAEPTQEDVFRSIGQNVGEQRDSGRVLGILAGIAGVVVLLVVVGQRRGGDARPKALHHHGKLMKEVLRTVPLKPAELKQLKLLLQESRARGGNAPVPESPLTLVLCPSVLLKAAQTRSEKVNRKVVAGLAKKLGER
jgi:hypothetical protein